MKLNLQDTFAQLNSAHVAVVAKVNKCTKMVIAFNGCNLLVGNKNRSIPSVCGSPKLLMEELAECNSLRWTRYIRLVKSTRLEMHKVRGLRLH